MKLNIQLGRSTKILGNVKLPPPLNLKFLWENSKGTRDYLKKRVKTPEIPMGKTKTVLGNIKLPPPLNFTFNWEDQQRY